MSRWDDLLAVQDLDTTADQLEHRRRHLPERAELEALRTRAAGIDQRIGELRTTRDALGRDQQRLDDEIATLRAKAQQSSDALYGGAVTNPRQLEAYQEEIRSIERRVSKLEDNELQIMEKAEPVDAELDDLASQRGALDESAASAQARIDEQEAEIDAQLTTVRAEREALASNIDPVLLEEYGALRGRLGGVAIARLVGGSCQGCHLGLSAIEVDRIKHLDPDEAVHCEECGRLLVR